MKILSLGSRGDDVKKMQEMLIKVGYSCGSYGAMEAAFIGASSIDVDGGWLPNAAYWMDNGTVTDEMRLIKKRLWK